VTLALILIVSGLVIGFGAFIFATFNMLRGVTREDPFSGNFFAKHIGAGLVTAFGGLVTFIGVIILVANILGQYGLL
jgi:hypothetical protein